MNKIGYKWHPIEDCCSQEIENADGELKALSRVWEEQRKELDSKGLVTDFLSRLQRKWAIETGIIERIYTLDRGVTQLLIEKGIAANYISHESTNKNPDLVAKIIQDQYEVIDGLFDFVKQVRPLSTSYIKELHAAFCRNQKTTQAVDQFGKVHDIKLESGVYKTMPNSPTQINGLIHEYCPPEQVTSEMDRLIDLYVKHTKQPIPPEVEAAWLHHRFVQIHPFQDGNGRVARALASLIFIKAGWFPLTITRDDRSEYIDALEFADGGSLRQLVQLFSRIQRNTFTSALGLAGQLQDSTQVSSVIGNIKAKLEYSRAELNKERENAKELANQLIRISALEMEKVGKELKTQLGPLIPGFSPYAVSALDGEPNDFYFRNQIIAMAKRYDYYANPSLFRAWSRLVLPGKNQAEILISAHCIGYEYRGVIAISACYFSRSETDDHQKEIGDFVTLGKEYFQLNYKDENKAVQARFGIWLNSVFTEGLGIWNSSIE